MKKANRRKMVGIQRAIRMRKRWLEAEQEIPDGNSFPPISWTASVKQEAVKRADVVAQSGG